MKKSRNRVYYAFFITVVIILGLGSRKFGHYMPRLAALYSGDVLWGLMIYLLAGFILQKQNTLKTAIAAFAFAALIEVSQLYHAPWIDAVRSNRLGGLLLGYGFLWSDLACYLAGIAIGMLLEAVLGNRPNQ